MNEQLNRWNMYNDFSLKSDVELHQRYNYLKKCVEVNEIKADKDLFNKLDVEKRIIDIIINPEVPELWINPEIDDFFKFDNSRELKDVKVKNYKHMGKVKFPIAQ